MRKTSIAFAMVGLLLLAVPALAQSNTIVIEISGVSSFVSGLIRSEVVLTTMVNESILGGLVIQIGDRLLDGSTKTRLEELRQRLHTGTATLA